MEISVLKQKSLTGLKWIILTTISVRILKFGTKVVLARLLSPSDFGLVAIGILVIEFFALFRDMGFGEALIFKRDDPDNAAASTMMFSLPVIALLMYSVIYIASPFIADFYDEMALTTILKIMGISLVIESLGTVPSILFEKDLDFKKKMFSDTLPKLFYAFVAIYLSLKGMGVWSLVIAHVVSSIILVVVIWKISRWKPSWKFNLTAASELFGYGKHIFVSGLIIFAVGNVGNIVAGKLVGIEYLGYYTIAFTIANLPSSQITHLVGKITFPVYSKLQQDIISLRMFYLKVMKYTSVISFPIAFGILALSYEIVVTVLGIKWVESVPVIQVLCFLGLFESISSNCISIFKSMGKPHIIWNINLLKLLAICLLIVPLTSRYGIVGTALSVTLPVLLFSFVMVHETSKILEVSTLSVYKQLSASIFCSIIMFIVVEFSKAMLQFPPAWQLGVLVSIGVCVYASLFILIEPKIVHAMKNLSAMI